MPSVLLDYFNQLVGTAEDMKKQARLERKQKETLLKKVLRKILLATKINTSIFSKYIDIFHKDNKIHPNVWKKILKWEDGDIYQLNMIFNKSNSAKFQMMSNYTPDDPDNSVRLQIHQSYTPQEKSRVRSELGRCLNDEDCLSPAVMGKWLCPALKKSLSYFNKKKLGGYKINTSSMVSKRGFIALLSFIPDVRLSSGDKKQSESFTLIVNIQLAVILNTVPNCIKIPTLIAKRTPSKKYPSKNEDITKQAKIKLQNGSVQVPYTSALTDVVSLPKIEPLKRHKQQMSFENADKGFIEQNTNPHTWQTNIEFIENLVYNSVKEEDYVHFDMLQRAVKMYNALASCPEERLPKLTMPMKHTICLHMYRQLNIGELTIMEILLTMVKFISECVVQHFCPSFLLPCTNIMVGIDIGGVSLVTRGLTVIEDKGSKSLGKRQRGVMKMKDHEVKITSRVVIAEEKTRKYRKKRGKKKVQDKLYTDIETGEDIDTQINNLCIRSENTEMEVSNGTDMSTSYTGELNHNMHNNNQLADTGKQTRAPDLHTQVRGSDISDEESEQNEHLHAETSPGMRTLDHQEGLFMLRNIISTGNVTKAKLLFHF